MAKWNVRLMDHNRCPMGTHWLMVDAIGKREAVEKYCREGLHQKWDDGDIGRVQIAEDGWVGEPTDYDVTAYKTHHDGELNFQLDLDE